MYRNSFYYEGLYLGSVINNQDDPFKALKEGEEKAEQIARALRAKIPMVRPGDIEIHSDPYNPQYEAFPELIPNPGTMQLVPGAVTLRTLKPGPLKEAS